MVLSVLPIPKDSLLSVETRATKGVSVLYITLQLSINWRLLLSYVESLENRVEKLDKLLRKVRRSYLWQFDLYYPFLNQSIACSWSHSFQRTPRFTRQGTSPIQSKSTCRNTASYLPYCITCSFHWHADLGYPCNNRQCDGSRWRVARWYFSPYW